MSKVTYLYRKIDLIHDKRGLLTSAYRCLSRGLRLWWTRTSLNGGSPKFVIGELCMHYLGIYIYICIIVYIYNIYICIYAYMHMYIYVCVCVCVCVCVFVYTHTHIWGVRAVPYGTGGHEADGTGMYVCMYTRGYVYVCMRQMARV